MTFIDRMVLGSTLLGTSFAIAVDTPLAAGWALLGGAIYFLADLWS